MTDELKEEVETEPEKVFTQADVDRIIKERLEREKTAREKSAAKAREEAEAEGLKKSEEWQTLAKKLEARVGELEPMGEQVTRYKGALEKYLEAEKKDLPKHVLVLLEKLDPADQMEYLTANREELGKGGKPEGVPASPQARSRSISEEEQEAARRGQANLYSNF